MFCPKCGVEYREGFTECADCHVPLTQEALARSPEQESAGMVPVLTSYNLVEIGLIKGALEREGIPYYYEGDSYVPYQDAMRSARLWVPKDRVEKVAEMIKEMREERMPIGPKEEDLPVS